MRKKQSFLQILAAVAVRLSLGFGLLNHVQGAEPIPQTNRWESAIEAFEATDKTNPPPPNAILFIGSSSIHLWPDLQPSFPGHKVFKRGISGSQLSDSVAFASRLAIPYQPKMILLYAGDNDIADGKSPEHVFSDFKAFVQKIHAVLPETYIGYIAIKPCPARERFLNRVKAANRLIKEYTASNDKLLFIDIFPPMLGKNSRLRPELFIQDGLHLNRKGYGIWNSIIKPVLDKYDPPATK